MPHVLLSYIEIEVISLYENRCSFFCFDPGKHAEEEEKALTVNLCAHDKWASPLQYTDYLLSKSNALL